MATSPDGTITVRVVLQVQVDPDAWARTMMDTDPDELLQKEIRRDVKTRVRNRIADWSTSTSEFDDYTDVPIGTVTAQGLYDTVKEG